MGVGGKPHASATRGVSHVTVNRHVQCVVTMLVTVFRVLVYYFNHITIAA